MDQETTYVRSDTMEQNNSHQAGETQSTNRGAFEWLKFVVFFAAIFLITVLIIRVIAPIIFTEYVPPIMGLTEESSELQTEAESTDSQEVPPIESGAESETVPVSEEGVESEASDSASEEGTENSADDSEEVVDGESEPLPTEEETLSKVDEEGAAESENPTSSIVYIVIPGDTLTSIAAASGLTVEQLQEANDLLNPNFLQAGQEILIPQQN